MSYTKYCFISRVSSFPVKKSPKSCRGECDDYGGGYYIQPSTEPKYSLYVTGEIASTHALIVSSLLITMTLRHFESRPSTSFVLVMSFGYKPSFCSLLPFSIYTIIHVHWTLFHHLSTFISTVSQAGMNDDSRQESRGFFYRIRICFTESWVISFTEQSQHLQQCVYTTIHRRFIGKPI